MISKEANLQSNKSMIGNNTKVVTVLELSKLYSELYLYVKDSSKKYILLIKNIVIAYLNHRMIEISIDDCLYVAKFQKYIY